MSYGKQNGGVLPKFTVDDLGTSFKVVLINSVKCSDGEFGREVYIPDYQGLIKKIAVTRAIHPNKLKGGDIKFLRKNLGLNSKDLAQKLDITGEHLSRCEGGQKVLSVNSEKVLRSLVIFEAVYVLRKAIEDSEYRTDEVLEKLSKLLDGLKEVMSGLKISPLHDVDDELVLYFHLDTQETSSAANDDHAAPAQEWMDQVA